MKEEVVQLILQLTNQYLSTKEDYDDVGVPPHRQTYLEARMDVLEDVIMALEDIVERS